VQEIMLQHNVQVFIDRSLGAWLDLVYYRCITRYVPNKESSLNVGPCGKPSCFTVSELTSAKQQLDYDLFSTYYYDYYYYLGILAPCYD